MSNELSLRRAQPLPRAAGVRTWHAFGTSVHRMLLASDVCPKGGGPCAGAAEYIRLGSAFVATHTYLDGTSPFSYLGSWAVGAIHSTATLSPEGTCGLYGLRLVHRPNIFQFCFGPRAGQAFFFWLLNIPNPNPTYIPNIILLCPKLCESTI